MHPLSIPNNPEEMFSHWLPLFHKDNRNILTVGCSAVLWSLWNIRNDRMRRAFKEKIDPVL